MSEQQTKIFMQTLFDTAVEVDIRGERVDLVTMMYSAMVAYPEVKGLILAAAQFWEMKAKGKQN